MGLNALIRALFTYSAVAICFETPPLRFPETALVILQDHHSDQVTLWLEIASPVKLKRRKAQFEFPKIGKQTTTLCTEKLGMFPDLRNPCGTVRSVLQYTLVINRTLRGSIRFAPVGAQTRKIVQLFCVRWFFVRVPGQ